MYTSSTSLKDSSMLRRYYFGIDVYESGRIYQRLGFLHVACRHMIWVANLFFFFFSP